MNYSALVISQKDGEKAQAEVLSFDNKRDLWKWARSVGLRPHKNEVAHSQGAHQSPDGDTVFMFPKDPVIMVPREPQYRLL